MKNVLLAALTALLLFSMSAALAQDPVSQNPDVYTVLYEDEEIRVMRVTYQPGAKDEPHSHPRYVVKALEGGSLLLYVEGSDPVETVIETGQVLLLDPVARHWAENIGDSTVSIIAVEYKQ